MNKLLILIAVFIFRCIPMCQQDSFLNATIINGLNKYRDELFLQDSQSIIAFGILLNEFEKNKIHLRNVINEIYQSNAFNSFNTFDTDFSKINKNVLRKTLGDSNILTKYNTDIVRVCRENTRLYQCIAMDVFEDKYPFKIKRNSKYFEEMNFYNVHNGECIAEIGAGFGTFSLLNAILFKNLKVYVNELDPYLIYSISHLKEICKSTDPTNLFLIIKGSKKSTNIESNSLDKIIIRDAFHHFKKKKKMLKSIKSNLKPQGLLYINEPEYYQNHKNPEGCKHVLPEDKIKAVIIEAGFEYLRRFQKDDMVLYEFRKAI